MIKKQDISVLIQGPLNFTSIDAIKDYSKFADTIIISTWDKDDSKYIDILNKINLLKKEDKINIEIYSYKTPDYKQMIINGELFGVDIDTTWYWQVQGLYNGVKECKTPFIIRTRSDEYYKNLQPLIDRFNNNGYKFTCGNVFFKGTFPDKGGTSYYHIGDHLYMSKISILKRALETILCSMKGDFQTQNYLTRHLYQCSEGTCAEIILGNAIVLAKQNIDIKNLVNVTKWAKGQACESCGHIYDISKINDDKLQKDIQVINKSLGKGDSSFNLRPQVFDVQDVNELKPIKWNWVHISPSETPQTDHFDAPKYDCIINFDSEVKQ